MTCATIWGVKLQTGDVAILTGIAGIVVYERAVANEDDLISRRVSAYRRHRLARVAVDAVVLATALHLTEYVRPEYDVYTYLMRMVRTSR